MGSVTQYKPVRTTSIACLNFFLDVKSDEPESKEQRDLQSILNFANGVKDDEGQELNQHYSCDWRELFFENMPFAAD